MAESLSPPRHGGLAARLPFFYGWVVVAVAFVTMGIGVNARTAFSLVFPPILDEFGWPRGETAATFSIGFATATLYAPFLGLVFDRFGIRFMLPLGALLVSGGFALASLASEIWQLYLTLGVLVVGGSISLTYIGHSMFLPNWFRRRRGLAVGIAFSGVGIGSILLFPLLQEVIAAAGWRRACWVLALLLLAIVVPLNLLLQRQRPEDLGLLPDGDEAPEVSRRTERALADNIVDPAWAATEWTLPLALRRARFWWLFVGFGAGLFTWYAVQVHQTRYLIEIGISAEQAALALGLVGLSGVVGLISLGHLSDRIGREWVWTLGALGFVLSCLLLLMLQHRPSLPLVYAMVAAQGLLGYGLSSVYASIPAELFQGRRLATIYGMLALAASLGAAGGPWLTGVIYDSTGSYAPAFWLCAAVSLFSILCAWQAAPRKVRLVAGQAAKRQAQMAEAGGDDD